MVCPWEPISCTLRGAIRNFLQASSAARANNSPSRKLSRAMSPAGTGAPEAIRSSSRRTRGGYVKHAKPSSRAPSRGGRPFTRTRATSIPSAEVPDIMPSTRMALIRSAPVGQAFLPVRREVPQDKGRAARSSCSTGPSFRNLLLQPSQQIHGAERAHVVEVSRAEGFQNFPVNRGKHGRLDGGRAASGAVAAGTGRKLGGELVLFLLVFGQDFTGAFDDRRGKAGETGHLDAVALVGAAGLYAA